MQVVFSFNPLGRGMGIGGKATMDSPSRLKSFNPLGRGMGIGGVPYEPTEKDLKIGFNPLGRGMGIGGSSKDKPNLFLIDVSIRLDAAWVLGVDPGKVGVLIDYVSIRLDAAWVLGGPGARECVQPGALFQSAWTRHGYWGS